jgi:hypothetical protein
MLYFVGIALRHAPQAYGIYAASIEYGCLYKPADEG